MHTHAHPKTTHVYTNRATMHTQEGNHRVHALKTMRENVETCPAWLHKDFTLPVNIYSEEMPDGMAVRYGRLQNELQTVHNSANFLDDHRFVLNIQTNLQRVTMLFMCVQYQRHARRVCMYHLCTKKKKIYKT